MKILKLLLVILICSSLNSISFAKDPSELMAVGNKDDIMELSNKFLDAGAQKLILRPIASGTEDILEQTNRLITEVLPEIASLRQRH